MSAEAWRRLAFALGGLLVALSLAITLYPEPPARAVIAPGGIIIDSGFQPMTLPASWEARDSIRKSPALVAWRSWAPESGSVPGEAHTVPFRLPPHLVVPYQGFAGEAGIRLYIECIASKATLDVAVARTNTQWSEAIVSRPHGWCAGDSRLVASTHSTHDYLAFGTPFRIDTVSWLKTRFLGLLSIYLLVFACVAGFCVAAAGLAWRRWPAVDPVVTGLAGLGLLGFAMFFLFQAGRAVGGAVSLLAIVFALLSLWRSLRADASAPPGRVEVARAWRTPLAAWAAVSLFCFALLYAADNGAGAWLANARFTPVRWSSDNQIPMLAGEFLVRKSVLELQLGNWLVSDRTPLSYGLHAWLRAGSLALTAGNDGHYLAPGVHSAIGVVINTAWVPVLVRVLTGLGLGRRRLLLALAVMALLPFCLFNSIYIWPKLLGGSFGLLAMCVLLLRPREAARESDWLCAALLSALALLCHGGTVFGILAMLLVAPFVRGLPRARTALACAAIVLALLAPWTAWQKLVQPPGNALVKSVFAGTYGWDDDPKMGVLATIARSYSRLDAAAWLQMKADGLRSVVLPATPQTCAQGEMAHDVHGVGALRVVDFISPFPSIRFLWLGLFALPLALARGARRAQARPALLLLGTGLLGVGLDLLLAWDCQIIHTQSYESMLAIALGLLLLLLQVAPRWLGATATALSIGYGLWVWIVDPLREGLRLDPFALAACAALLLLPLLLARRADDAEAAA